MTTGTGSDARPSPTPPVGRAGSSSGAVLASIGLFVVWTLATWLLEGRIETLLRSEAALDRAIYAVVANLLIGTAAAVMLLAVLARDGRLSPDRAGFGRGAASARWLLAAIALGLAFLVLRGLPSWHPAVLLNAYAQVLVVSVAEVVVCWSLLGASVEAALRRYGRATSLAGAALAASLAFGVYHYAHSAPFDSHRMVLFLSGVGLVTGAFFLASRDVYATILFHNFLGVLGVVGALEASGRLETMRDLQPLLLGMAGLALAVLIASHRLILGRSGGA